MPRPSHQEREKLKQRAANGDEAAAEKLKTVRADDANRYRCWAQKQKSKPQANVEEPTEHGDPDSEEAVEETYRIKRYRNKTNGRFAAGPPLTPSTEVDDDTRVMFSGKTPTTPAEIIELSDDNDEELIKAELAAAAQDISVATFPVVKKEKRSIDGAEIQLKLEKLARKKAKAALDKKLVEIEKALLEDEDAEADLKLELLRAQKMDGP